MRRKRQFEDSPASAVDAAASLLARREHAQRELRLKLARKGYSSSTLDEAIDLLLERDWLSESRYAAFMARHRASQGRGPRYVRAELQSHGVAEGDIEAALTHEDVCWQEACRHAVSKLRGADDPNHMAKWRQKLYQRGFGPDQIDAALEQHD